MSGFDSWWAAYAKEYERLRAELGSVASLTASEKAVARLAWDAAVEHLRKINARAEGRES